MFNIGPMEFLVLAAVGFVLIGPERLPQLAKDAAQLLRSLRDMAQGARTQLADELPDEFKNFNPANLNPRTAIRNAILGDEDFSGLNPSAMIQKALRDESVDPPTAGGASSGPPSAPKDHDAT